MCEFLSLIFEFYFFIFQKQIFFCRGFLSINTLMTSISLIRILNRCLFLLKSKAGFRKFFAYISLYIIPSLVKTELIRTRVSFLLGINKIQKKLGTPTP